MVQRFDIRLATTGILWAVAGSILYLDLSILPDALSPLAAGLADGTALLKGLSRAGVRLFVPSLAAYTLLAIIPAWAWRRFELRQLAPLMPVVALVGDLPSFGARLLVGVVLPLTAGAAAIAYWFHEANEKLQRWFYFLLPVTLCVLGSIGITFAWLCRYPLRDQAGSNPEAAFAVLSVTRLAAVLPALFQLKTNSGRAL
jgi:hypothetical protein